MDGWIYTIRLYADIHTDMYTPGTRTTYTYENIHTIRQMVHTQADDKHRNIRSSSFDGWMDGWMGMDLCMYGGYVKSGVTLVLCESGSLCTCT